MLLVFGGFVSTATNSLTHGVLNTLPAAQILFFKAFFGLIILLGLNVRDFKALVCSQQKRWHLLKGVAGAFGNLLWISALISLPLADCSALSLTSALFTSTGAYLFFRERITWPIALSLSLGFFGVWLILNPTHSIFGWVALLPLGSALLFSISSLLVKKLTVRDSFSTTLFYLLFFMSLISGCFAFSKPLNLTLEHFLYLFLMGAFYLVGQWALVKAYAIAHAGFIAPFKFARFPLSIMSGVLLFGEIPGVGVIFGSLAILSSYSFLKRAKNLKSYREIG